MTARTAFGHRHWCAASCAIRDDNSEREQAKDDGSSAHRCLHCGSQLAS
ncbi:hypothetical protein KURONO_3492 [Mycobacterium tuberculosis str. Kurono]|nr:hypothetical protein [Mycobacterium tuberculosis]BAQ07271.1 hypothetical protein KURONO_3492 [Mycobacterium tuberculosis str. Kurono]